MWNPTVCFCLCFLKNNNTSKEPVPTTLGNPQASSSKPVQRGLLFWQATEAVHIGGPTVSGKFQIRCRRLNSRLLTPLVSVCFNPRFFGGGRVGWGRPFVMGRSRSLERQLRDFRASSECLGAQPRPCRLSRRGEPASPAKRRISEHPKISLPQPLSPKALNPEPKVGDPWDMS